MNTVDYNFGSGDIETTIINSEPSIIIKEIIETKLPAYGKTKKLFFRLDKIFTLNVYVNSFHEFDYINHQIISK